ncbi:MAG: Fe(3+) ABC transporter substrate-binding protein [Alphaproteobacteria bacterium]|nr:Fe(3+) ABC transporter substrate-binding protein [Alphaproteobacteria bacterium]
MRFQTSLLAAASLSATLIGAPAMAEEQAALNGEVNVYSYRQPFLIQPMFDTFTRETGVKVNVVFANKGLVERLKQEGVNSPADLIFTVDIGRLDDAYAGGVTQPVSTPVLTSAIPQDFRQNDGHWYGLTQRARIVYASKDRVPPSEAPKTYEELADPKWKGRICTRSGTHVYQVALTAAMIAHHGEEKAEEWLRGLKANLARKPQGNDRAQVKAIKEGECDISIGNNYYFGAMLQNEEQFEWAQSVYPVFPTIAGEGTHVNISGMALTRSAPNRDNAVKLMEFLAGDLAQQMYAEQNFEYPIVAGVPRSGLVRSMGEFEADTLDLDEVAANRSAAVKLVNKVGYND